MICAKNWQHQDGGKDGKTKDELLGDCSIGDGLEFDGLHELHPTNQLFRCCPNARSLSGVDCQPSRMGHGCIRHRGLWRGSRVHPAVVAPHCGSACLSYLVGGYIANNTTVLHGGWAVVANFVGDGIISAGGVCAALGGTHGAAQGLVALIFPFFAVRGAGERRQGSVLNVGCEPEVPDAACTLHECPLL